MMTAVQLLALAPWWILAAVVLGVMIVVPFWRNVRLTCGVSVAGLVLTLVSVVTVWPSTPLQVTPLIAVDRYALLFAGLIVLTAIGVALLAYDYFKERGVRPDEFFILLLLSTLGGMTLVASTHFASFFLSLELLSVSIYALISYPARGLITLEAALKYLILSGMSSAFMLFGTALLYTVLGSLSFQEIAAMNLTASGTDQVFLVAGLAMLLAGLMFKLSLVPFHMWTPDVYEGAPAPVTAFVATISKGAIFALLLRLFLETEAWRYESAVLALSIVAIASMLAGNVLALLQNNVKRILAYSSIAHIGYLFVAFIAGGMAGGKALAIEASIWYLIAYFITTLGAFGVVSILSLQDHERDIDDITRFNGLFWRRPAIATSFTAMLLSLAGIPLTVGFIGKFYVFAAGVQSALWVLVGTVIVGSGIGLFYYLRIIFAMATKSDAVHSSVPIPVAGGWVMAMLTLTLLMFGVYPTPVIDLINQVIGSLV